MVVISRRDFSRWRRCFRWRQETNAVIEAHGRRALPLEPGLMKRRCGNIAEKILCGGSLDRVFWVICRPLVYYMTVGPCWSFFLGPGIDNQ